MGPRAGNCDKIRRRLDIRVFMARSVMVMTTSELESSPRRPARSHTQPHAVPA